MNAKVRVVAPLTDEDLALWRNIEARCQAIETNPTAFSGRETEAALIDRWRRLAEFHRTYSYPEEIGEIDIDPVTGRCTFIELTDDEDE